VRRDHAEVVAGIAGEQGAIVEGGQA